MGFLFICHLGIAQVVNNEDLLPSTKQDSIQKSDFKSNDSTHVSKKGNKISSIDTSKNCFSCKPVSPKKVAMYAAMCPGLGQIYNRKYWKLPIVYAGLGTGIFFISYSGKNLRTFNQALSIRLDTLPDTHDQFVDNLDDNQLIAFRDYHRKNLQLAVFGTVAWWGLSIIDATVDAHLRSFDISDDLSMKIKPTFFTVQNSIVPSVNISLRWK